MSLKDLHEVCVMIQAEWPVSGRLLLPATYPRCALNWPVIRP